LRRIAGGEPRAFVPEVGARLEKSRWDGWMPSPCQEFALAGEARAQNVDAFSRLPPLHPDEGGQAASQTPIGYQRD